MATIKPISRFIEYDLSPKEEINGGLLTFDQKILLTNDRASVANLILNNVYNPLHPDLFNQQDAHLKGQLSVYDFLFARSEESENSLRQLNQPNQS